MGIPKIDHFGHFDQKYVIFGQNRSKSVKNGQKWSILAIFDDFGVFWVILGSWGSGDLQAPWGPLETPGWHPPKLSPRGDPQGTPWGSIRGPPGPQN